MVEKLLPHLASLTATARWVEQQLVPALEPTPALVHVPVQAWARARAMVLILVLVLVQVLELKPDLDLAGIITAKQQKTVAVVVLRPVIDVCAIINYILRSWN